MNFLPNFFKKKVTSKPVPPPPSPSPSLMVVPELNRFWNEDAALDYVIRKYGNNYDRDTGLHRERKTHWSWDFVQIARKVKFKTTSGWPDNTLINLLLEDLGGIRLARNYEGSLRFIVDINIRHEILNDWGRVSGDELFRKLILSRVGSVVEEVEPSSIGVITGSMILRHEGILYWNPDYYSEFPCEKLLLTGYYDFRYGVELNETS